MDDNRGGFVFGFGGGWILIIIIIFILFMPFFTGGCDCDYGCKE